ncbi:hypothetical protein DFA_01878 [Cavenderia fasciculata]|uniref:Dienelactone hydrolase domain-containing protein n=1 Tax=Cavenderia fasciculata TaxID=261658 RepID=F4PV84_CACFS|nr:uncharacterized protein DFA_01878 [Cavenderia fasciculata]EGG21992.1 hypothetical protein DFA_01878 [Cavenderia fasciculata]|eukprot:XP_004359843.1 hypothetical protein DFA_01878 [Cavenderia fasciculata]
MLVVFTETLNDVEMDDVKNDCNGSLTIFIFINGLDFLKINVGDPVLFYANQTCFSRYPTMIEPAMVVDKLRDIYLQAVFFCLMSSSTSSTTDSSTTTSSSSPSPPSTSILSPPYLRPSKVGKKNVTIQVQGKEDKTPVHLEGFLSYIEDEHNANKDSAVYRELMDVGIVITHPHPMLGGCYQNNVVLGLASYITNHLHVPTLCFNFRGVRKSTGSGSWRGGSERADTLGAVDYLLNEVPLDRRPSRIIIIGYSYGSVIGMSIASERDAIIGAVAVSFPFGPLTLMLLGHLLDPALLLNKPKYFVIGDQDNFTGTTKFKQRMNEMKGDKDKLKHKIYPNIDHFYGGQEKMLAKDLCNWVLELLNLPITPINNNNNEINPPSPISISQQESSSSSSSSPII